MLEVTLSFAPHVSRRSAFAELTGRRYQIPVTLVDGENTFTSDDFAIGSLPSSQDGQLMARITFQYTYDEAAHLITVDGTDFAAENSISLVNAPGETSELPGIDEVLRRTARAASESLINSLQMRQGLIVRVRTDPPVLSVDDYLKLVAVYRDGPHQGLFGEIDDGAAEEVVQAIQSTWGGVVTFNVNENFANVIGSAGDPKINGLTWIMVWANQFGLYPNLCSSLKYLNFKCGQPIFGGHVILGTVAQRVATGSNSVYIMPICQQHNNDDNTYMAAITTQDGIWLKNYMQ